MCVCVCTYDMYEALGRREQCTDDRIEVICVCACVCVCVHVHMMCMRLLEEENNVQMIESR